MYNELTDSEKEIIAKQTSEGETASPSTLKSLKRVGIFALIFIALAILAFYIVAELTL